MQKNSVFDVSVFVFSVWCVQPAAAAETPAAEGGEPKTEGKLFHCARPNGTSCYRELCEFSMNYIIM